jgi:hypothetical protein
MIACIGGKTSPVTMAMYKQFGDPFRHEPRTTSTTLAQLLVALSKADPSDLQAFFREAQCFRLNGVNEPFFRDFPMSCPRSFITPEMLHKIHKEFWDHDVKWCLNLLSDSKLDFDSRFCSPLRDTITSRAGSPN